MRRVGKGREASVRVSKGVAHTLTVLLLYGPSVAAQQYSAAETALRTGKYDDAIAAYTRLAASEPPPVAAINGLVRSLAMVGRYDEAEAAARRSPDAANSLGEILYLRGRWDEAATAFKQAVARKTPDHLTAELNLAILDYDRGRRAAAMRAFERFIQIYNRSERLTSEELTAVGTACRYLSRDNPQLAKDALKAFDEAIAADLNNLEPRIREGELFLERYNSTDAEESFQSVLNINSTHPRAILGMARSKSFDGDPEAYALAEMALTVNPSMADANVFLAILNLGLEERVAAENRAEAALAINPSSLEALAVLAATHFLRHDDPGFEEARDRALALNPTYADFYNTLAELAAQNRLYAEGVSFARQAVQLDPQSWRGYSLLGVGLLRTGDVPAGRAALETAFTGDPYNVWTKNTLDLLDRLQKFRETRSPRFLFVIDPKESDLLSPYLAELGEQAYDQLAARYRYRPSTPVRLEIFPSHADFSVRTMGLTGLGALGVSFGSLLAMDSPSARELGHFNWGSTFWHELTHAFTLGATGNRIPRWFSEGLSVYEERRAGRGWGDDVTMEFLVAYQQSKLLPLERLNDGFVRPAFPEQIFFSYYQASLVCEMIERDAGMDGILDMLAAYREGFTTVEVFQRVLHTTVSGFDVRFDAFLRQRFARPLAAIRMRSIPRPGKEQGADDLVRRARADTTDFVLQLAAGRALVEERKMDAAVPYLERAQALFPDYVAEDSPYWLLAQIKQQKGLIKDAADELARLTAINENDYRANLEEAKLREGLADLAGAAQALERAIYISPMEPSVHAKLAALYARTGEKRKAIRERKAVLALDPVDRAEALYQLAAAYFEAGDLPAARGQVLRSLEEAPSFEKAQELLLRIRSAR
ncbi:MAG: tetratricopeptide repeat protein [Gemmatimonadetes bacterium]|nr:tetratricopeptide repeat protein [Gemmatimonadota bacterium]